jgi:opacity protein-like surface antigen
MRRWPAVAISLLLVLAGAPAASAFSAGQTFHPGALSLSGELGGGSQGNIRGGEQTGLDLFYTGFRLGWFPFGAAGPGVLNGALEAGAQALYQKYTAPVDAFWAGAGVNLRYHFLSLGRFVPYVEAGASAGGTDLDVKEIDSNIAFLLQAGVGASLFITDRTALYLGYRLIHISNADIEQPNHGFEAHTGLFGVTFFLK